MEESSSSSSGLEAWLRGGIYEFMTCVQQLLRRYGWPVVFSLIILYNVWPYISSFLTSMSRAHAMRAERRIPLDSEREKVREKQQEAYRRMSQEAKLEEQQRRKVKGTEKTPEEKEAAAEALKALINKHKRDNPSKFGGENPRSRGGVSQSRRRG